MGIARGERWSDGDARVEEARWRTYGRDPRGDPMRGLINAADTCFGATYADARSLVLGAAAVPFQSYVAKVRGPQQEPLFTDTIWVGPREAANVAVVLSGVHGTEGRCGSGIQVDWLSNNGTALLGPDQAMLIVHAVNPYGFAWDRRVTEEGCDLNRNFVDFSKPPPANTAFDEIRDYLVPPDRDERTLVEAERKIAEFRARHGERAFQTARKSGQYTDPKGMFFGGAVESAARVTLERIAKDHQLDRRAFVGVIDVHTGVGPFGYGEVESEHHPDSSSHAVARQIFGPGLASAQQDTSFSVPVHGSVGALFERMIPDGRFVYVCLEFGTFDQESSRRAYQLDHWYYGYGEGRPDTELGLSIRRTMRDHFFADYPEWREMVLFRGRQVIRQLVLGSRESPS